MQGDLGGGDCQLTGNHTEALFGPLLRSGVIDPFGPNTEAVVQQMRATEQVGWANQDQSFQVGIDPTYADPRGRMYYGAIRYAFK